MNLKKIATLLETPGVIGTLSTADGDGLPNCAVFGSVRLIDEQIIVGMGNNRTLSNLYQNPHATLLLMIPGTSLLNFQGMRLYLKMNGCEESGELFEKIKAEVTREAGRGAAKMIGTVISFDILDGRSLIDLSRPTH
ncbi:MAG: pyridoxamine 5'-phosphate oxidase family protein [Desulfuromonadaceae bacterium]|nr:pyridoxamine 5'-phosphate oxidase family protein [Desulfuromonadaceae bacterium]